MQANLDKCYRIRRLRAILRSEV